MSRSEVPVSAPNLLVPLFAVLLFVLGTGLVGQNGPSSPKRGDPPPPPPQQHSDHDRDDDKGHHHGGFGGGCDCDEDDDGRPKDAGAATDAGAGPVCPPTPYCGNGIVEPANGEVCDDGNNRNGDSCASDCRSIPVCGNGVLDPGEQCDDGNQVNTDACLNNCVLAGCGNGRLEPWRGEVCDDGNTINGDNCSADCRSLEICGNRIIDVGEQCDTGGESASCNSDCTVAYCGDGKVNKARGEQCDTHGPTTECTVFCRLPACGDGVVTPPEQCDDGNDVNDDGCTNDCTYQVVCGDADAGTP